MGNLLPQPPFTPTQPWEITGGIRNQWQALPKSLLQTLPKLPLLEFPWAGICLQSCTYLAQPYEVLQDGEWGRGEAKAKIVETTLKGKLFQERQMTKHGNLQM